MVAYKVDPRRAPEMFVTISDRGELHQEDSTDEQKKKNEILQKVVLPFIRGIVRIEGSKYAARDYISHKLDADVNPRVRLQNELMKKVAPECEKLGVLIDSITLAEIEQPDKLAELAKQIADREQARIEREKNKDLVAQHEQEQELAANQALIEQRRAIVEANTKLKVETENVLRAKEVEETKLKTELKSAEARLQAARDQAKALETRGKAEAEVIKAENEAEVAGLKTAIAGFPSADTFAQYHMMMRMAPSLTEVFASDQSDFAKLFAEYMAGGKKVTPLPTPAGGGVAGKPSK
jgi:septal ring factor EnvC (AmiA/AmiB activator)